MKLSRLSPILFAMALPAIASKEIRFPYKQHYVCTWLITGSPQRAPDLYTAVNAHSGAMSLQRTGSQVYYAKKVADGLWQEINPAPDQAAEIIRVSSNGVLDTYQAKTRISTCTEIE